MVPASTARILLSTAGSADEAARIARVLIEEQLAACVNILPGVHSIYRWQGRVVDDAECLLLIKSDLRLLTALEARVKALHSYENPEFLVIVPESGSEAYLLWMGECLSQRRPEDNPSI